MVVELNKEHIAEYKEIVKCLWKDIQAHEIDEIIMDHNLGKSKVYVYIQEKKVVGFVNLSVRNDYVEGATTKAVGYVEGIYVCELNRRNQVAYKLINEGISFFKSLGIKELGSDTEIENEMSQIFHKAIGFHEVSTIKHYIMRIGD